jgi:hypothetical protein
MSGELDNAFTRSIKPASAQGEVNTAPIAPLQASWSQLLEGWRLTLNPMRAADTVAVLTTCSAARTAQTIVFGVAQTNVRERGCALPLAAACRRLEIPVTESFGDDAVIVSDQALRQLLSELHTTAIRVVRVDGPIERRDAMAILAAIEHGVSPLDVECRAVASMIVRDDREVELEVREQAHAAALVAENFRQYLAAVMGRAIATVSAPFHWQVQRMLEVSGGLTVRPAETDIFSGFVDVGVCAAIDDASAGPAELSIIYDIPSDTWHDES